MALPRFDLQAHSTCSDGELTPAQTVQAADAAGVELLALTDHDSTDGVAEATATTARAGLRLVPAVEISVLDAAASDIHICGYLVNPADRALQDQLKRSRDDRANRAQAMSDALTALGWKIDEAPLAARRTRGQTIGRPHLATAVVTHPANAGRLAREGLSDPTAFLVAYLIEGAPAFRPRGAPPVAAAIALIHGAGGLAVWAHPFWDLHAAPAVLDTAERFRAAGLDGIEAFYVTHTEPQTRLLHEYCKEHRLISTGSADFHGPNHVRFNRFRAFETFGLTPDLGPLAAI